ncbi:MAG: T9SS type A sorting domain-containing protein [Bacteroidetes bacterium]|nr:T9SS type A sorting domain-containing protein [Bacteroidota bacterium]
MRFFPSFILATIFFILSISQSHAQLNCGADPVHEFLMENDPAYATERELVELKILQLGPKAEERRSTYTIPVVVHIMHIGEAVGVGTNITDAKVMQAIQGANDRWNDMNGPGPNMDVEFCLAAVDPDGHPTTGINRVNASGVTDYLSNGLILNYEGNSNELELKNLSNWPHDQYYNIWVITKFNAGWGGYAYYPTGSNFAIDGAAIISTSMHQNTSLVSHELGHGLGLFHTFEGANGATCPANTSCSTQGDRVCDTPPHTQNQCSSTNCTTEGDLNRIFDNYMSYCGGLNRFTQGQKDRVDNALLTTTRNDLLTAGTCTYACEDVFNTINTSTCDPLVAGTTIDTLIAFSGCDSIVTTITLLNSYDSTIINLTTCDPLQADTATEYLTNSNTCDSFVTTVTALIPAAMADFDFSINGLEVSFTNTSDNAESIEWLFGDDTGQNGGNSALHTYANATVFEASVIATNECGSDTTSYLIDLSVNAIGLQDILDVVQLTPNPNNGNFQLQIKASSLHETLELTVLDVTGKLIERSNVLLSGNLTQTYSLKALTAGRYYLKIQSKQYAPLMLPFEVVR